jgi:hypothetical protein
MNNARILDHLLLAEEHVAKSKQQVARQREIVAVLERRGSDAAVAKQLLACFEEALELQTVTLDRCRREWHKIKEITPQWETA